MDYWQEAFYSSPSFYISVYNYLCNEYSTSQDNIRTKNLKRVWRLLMHWKDTLDVIVGIQLGAPVLYAFSRYVNVSNKVVPL